MSTKYSYETHTTRIERLSGEFLQCTDEGDFVGAGLALAGMQVELSYLESKFHAHKNEGVVTAYRIRNPEGSNTT